MMMTPTNSTAQATQMVHRRPQMSPRNVHASAPIAPVAVNRAMMVPFPHIGDEACGSILRPFKDRTYLESWRYRPVSHRWCLASSQHMHVSCPKRKEKEGRPSLTNCVYLRELALKCNARENTSCHGCIVGKDYHVKARDGPDGSVQFAAS